MKLDLGCGDVPIDGHEGVDLYAESAKHKVNLFKFPWPFATDSIEALHASHFIEHIPMCFASGGNLPESAEDKDLLVTFFDECYRVLQPNGVLVVRWPALQSVRAFQDPTHRRFVPSELLWYLSKEWREMNKLGHYLGACNFAIEMCSVDLAPILQTNGEFRSQEAVSHAVTHHWNMSMDFQATLRAIK